VGNIEEATEYWWWWWR